MRASLLLLAVTILGALACDSPGAQIVIKGASATRDAQKRVAVDIDLVAHEHLGGNVGTYCTRVTFAGQALPTTVCSTDLSDGDRKTQRIVSDGDVPPDGAIAIRIRLATTDVEWNLVAPPR